MEIEVIAHIHTPLPEKFGLPRQSGLAPDLKGTIVFEDKFSDMKAVEGLDGYDYIWILWEFEGVKQDEFRPRVRPPRLGGNTYMGVFATRSPFRPNPIGLSCVKLDSIEETASGPVLHVSGIDLRDNTPIYDIKPYLPYVDAHPGVRGGFTDITGGYKLEVDCSEEILQVVEPELREGLLQILGQDPRPAYQDDPERVYGMDYDKYAVKFRVDTNKLVVNEISIK